MASAAQITANRLNAQHSTGPVTSEGKARASQNSAKFGLFAKRDFVPPQCREEYETFCEGLFAELHPDGVAETVLTREVVSAFWRLERCAQMEAAIDPNAGFIEHLPLFTAIDRARSAAERSLARALAELRKVQTENRARREPFSFDDLGVASMAGVARARGALVDAITRAGNRRAASLRRHLEKPAPDPYRSDSQNEPDSAPAAPSIPRNAPCPCGSGEKYKRCCGVFAPPVLMNAKSAHATAA